MAAVQTGSSSASSPSGPSDSLGSSSAGSAGWASSTARMDTSNQVASDSSNAGRRTTVGVPLFMGLMLASGLILL